MAGRASSLPGLAIRPPHAGSLQSFSNRTHTNLQTRQDQLCNLKVTQEDAEAATGVDAVGNMLGLRAALCPRHTHRVKIGRRSHA